MKEAEPKLAAEVQAWLDVRRRGRCRRRRARQRRPRRRAARLGGESGQDCLDKIRAAKAALEAEPRAAEGSPAAKGSECASDDNDEPKADVGATASPRRRHATKPKKKKKKKTRRSATSPIPRAASSRPVTATSRATTPRSPSTPTPSGDRRAVRRRGAERLRRPSTTPSLARRVSVTTLADRPASCRPTPATARKRTCARSAPTPRAWLRRDGPPATCRRERDRPAHPRGSPRR